MLPKPSRSVLVAFFNETLQLQITKVDDLGDGAAYCQLLDSIHGDVPMHRVVFDTRNSMHMESNFKILQQAFMRHGIAYNFDPPRLMKCRLQDNLEFAQWFYQYWHETARITGYDPVARRQSAGSSVPGSGAQRLRPVRSMAQPALGVHSSATPQPQAQAPPQNRQKPVQAPALTPARAPRLATSHAALRTVTPAGSFIPAEDPRTAHLARENAALREEMEALREELAALRQENGELTRSIDVATEERALYYGKLLDVEQCMDRELDAFYAEKGGSASMEDPTNPTLQLIRKLQEYLCYSPEGFQAQVTADDEPF